MTDILMPALSPTMEEGNLAKWHVKVGDKVESGQVIAEIETDKATMEVEAVDEGVVTEILVPAGTEGVKVNALIARLDDGSAPAAKSAPAPAAPAKAEAAPPPAAGPTTSATPAPAAAAPAPTVSSGDRVFASPLAKRLASAKGVDLKSMAGSGPHGRIIARDIDGARPGAAPAPAAASASASAPRQVLSLEQMGIAPAPTSWFRSATCARPSRGV